MFFFAVWAGPGPPPKQQKKTCPRPKSKTNNTRKAQTTKKTRQQKNKHSYPYLSVLPKLFLIALDTVKHLILVYAMFFCDAVISSVVLKYL